MKARIAAVLEAVHAGKMTPAQALERLKHLPFQDLEFAKIDHHRELRRGAPEVIYGEGKTPAQIVRIAREIVRQGSNLLITRVDAPVWRKVRPAAPKAAFNEAARTICWVRTPAPPGRGAVAVMTAGTSDIPVAEEAAVTLEFLGNEVDRIYDVGVAGLHRLLGRYERIRKARVVVAVAGMEGALPGVVAGLVATPVIAVPTSVGYGASFQGLSALLTMLNSCPGGLAVVNIDNGFGAAVMASLINHL